MHTDSKKHQTPTDANNVLAAVREMCSKHNPVKLSFLQWQDYCRENYEDGEEQKQCSDCGYWFFDLEM